MRFTPSVLPSMSGSTPKLPAAVEAVWLPWPSSSRGERNEPGAMSSGLKPSTKKRAPISLLLQSSAVKPGPVWHVPFQVSGTSS